MEVDVVETGQLRRPHRPADRARPPQPDRARVRGAAPGRRLRVHDPLATSRSPAGSGRARRRSSPGLVAADSIFELGADLLAEATRLEGHPDNVAAALLGGFVLCTRRRTRSASSRRPASSACSSCPAQAVRTQKAREALPSRIPVADAVFNIAHASLLVLGLARGDLGLVARGLRRPHPPAAPRAPLSALVGAGAAGARASARSARRSPAPARPCSSGATSSPPAPWPRGCTSSRRRLGARSAACRSRPRAPKSARCDRPAARVHGLAAHVGPRAAVPAATRTCSRRRCPATWAGRR